MSINPNTVMAQSRLTIAKSQIEVLRLSVLQQKISTLRMYALLSSLYRSGAISESEVTELLDTVNKSGGYMQDMEKGLDRLSEDITVAEKFLQEKERESIDLFWPGIITFIAVAVVVMGVWVTCTIYGVK